MKFDINYAKKEMLNMTNMDGEIKVRNIELRLDNIQYAIVTLESGDKFAVRGKLKDNLIDFMDFRIALISL